MAPVRGTLIAVALATTLALSACASTAGTDTGDPEVAPEMRPGLINIQQSSAPAISDATVTLAELGEPRSLDPTVTSAAGENGGNVLMALYDTLVRFNIETQQYEPWLAEAVDSDAEGRVWTIRLRPEATFSDGSVVDADAVRTSLERYIDSGATDAGTLTELVESIDTDGSHSLTVSLSRPWPNFVHILTQGAGMITAPNVSTGDDFTPIGAGPFVFEHYSPQEELVLQRRDGYWGGEVQIERLRFIWIPNDQARAETHRSGGAQVALLRNGTTVREALDDENSGYLAWSNLGRLMLINNREGRPGEDPRVRKAMALAIDPTFMDERIQDGAGQPGHNLFQPASRWHTGKSTTGTDLEAARQLVDEAKSDGFDGRLSFVASNDPSGQAEGLAVKALLEAVGFEIEIDTQRTTADTYRKVSVDRDFDLATGAFSATEEEPSHRLYTNLHSQSPRNVIGYADSEMDELMSDLRYARSDEERLQVLGQVEELWTETVPSVVWGASASFSLWDPRLQDVYPTSERMLIFSDAWLADEVTR